MQHLPGDVLQSTQQQGEEGHGSRDREGGEATAGGRRGSLQRLTPPSSQVSLPLTSPHISRAASSSPPTSSIVPSASPSESARETLRPSRDELDRRWSSLGEDARLRSGHRSGSPPTPPRSPTSETVPSQLLGGRAGTDADLLREDESTQSCSSWPDVLCTSTAQYHNASYEATAARLRNLLSPDWSHRQDHGDAGNRVDAHKESPPKTPSSSESARTRRTINSSASNASSLAFFVSNTRADVRLFKRKSQPLAHLKKQTPLARRPVEHRRNSSYYKPKVVEDSAPSKGDTHRNLRGSLSLSMADFIKDGKTEKSIQRELPPPSRLHNESGRSSSSLHSPHRSRSVSPAPRRPIQQMTPKRSLLQPVSSNKGVTQTSPLTRKPNPSKPRLEGPGSPEPHDTARRQPVPSSISLPPPVVSAHAQGHHHHITPPEADPRTPAHHRSVRGDHYFRTFGSDTIYKKELSPGLASPEKASPASKSSGKIAWRTPADKEDSSSRPPERRRRSSVFRLRRKTAILDEDLGILQDGPVKVRPALKKTTPGISLTTPAEAETQARGAISTSSELTLPHYFALSRRRDHSSAASSSSARSPGAIVSLRPGGARRRLTSSDESSQLSPFTIPRRPRLYNTRTLESIADAEPSPGGSRLASQEDVKQSHRKSSRQSSPRLTSMFSVGARKDEAGIDTKQQPEVPAMPKRAETVKQVVFDSREVKPEASSPTLRGAADAKDKRGPSLGSITSLSSLFRAMAPKPTQNKLRRKSSAATATSIAYSRAVPLPPRRNLEVTGF